MPISELAKNDKNFNALLELNAIITGREHLSKEELWGEIEKGNEKSYRKAKLEEYLADYINYDISFPGDVTVEEIVATLEHYKNDTITRVHFAGRRGGGDMGDMLSGKTYNPAEDARAKVLALIESGGPVKNPILNKALSDFRQAGL